MAFSSSGGPPPKMAREKGLSGGQKPYGFRFYEKLASGKNKKIGFLQIDKGEEKVPILILDVASLDDGNEWDPSVYIHEKFRYNNTWQNYAICRCKTPEGCSLDAALQEPHTHAPWCKKPADEKNPQEGECDKLGKPEPRKGAWRWVFTAIKLKPFTFERGKMIGKTIPYQRCLGLASEDQFKELLAYRKAYKGLRGRLFNVSRSDGQFSAKIGDKWDPVEEWSDEKMMEHFADAAADYGLSPEDYVKAFDYEKVLPLPTVAEMAEISKWVAGERGINLDNPSAPPSGNPVANAVSDAATGDDENPEEDVPF